MDILHPRFLRQVRAARSLLGWSQKQLAEQSGASLSTLNRFERGDGSPNVNSLRLIYKAFERAGIQFVNSSDGSMGVLLSAEGLNCAEKMSSFTPSETNG
ncbi:helix-turn-helix domain-containing protein [Ferrovum myxofaciens]|jgi:transcriptional regulator with XRE-family HTH domain|uniref:Helix-turn-helix protein n=2 Tax=root TaxID=1 RepID=A0A8F3DVE7_9PROT|nr:helix-turn-helix transcriptional regulator [Ferrovum myxofaciens]KXW57104.1 helix-turn-helix protein [Ferrovum myxofaciens]MBU6994238.1 helix-turn-helix transcriptional regulator [Ferrovum myxofaciens]QKE38132.1 MAG: helix-turn-helix transcriptional regulator [Ferrovum myxofaciens]QWY75857.1 MAG: helix-turn-helix transcriptional regulator [Ferrovum myxofaciens]QWY78588.1 MAG: helix-turn-helix transcriptional regulator [Ferrovum myxofaciens]